MTKSISRIDPNDPFRGLRNSEYHISISTPKSPTRKDTGRQKKVKFAALEKKSPTNCTHIPSEREKVTKCADTDPKTSEYAFFKKLKKDAGRRFCTHSLQKDAYLSKKPESKDYSRDRIDYVRAGSKVFNSSRIVKDVSTFKTDSFLSPSGGDLNKSEQHSISGMWKNSQGSVDSFKPQDTFPHEGNQYVHGEVFSRKRQKLRQFVADALFLDREKLCSKGHDIVSVLLGRLFPMSIEEKKSADPNSGKAVNATGYYLRDSRESDVQFEEHHQMPSRKPLELESSLNFKDHLLSPMFHRSEERITPYADSSTSNSHMFQPLYSITEPGCEFGATPSFRAKSDVTQGFLFNEVVVNATSTRYGLLDSRKSDGQFKEPRQIPKRKFLELESSSYARYHLLSPMFLRSDKRIIPPADFPTSDSHAFQSLYSTTEPECECGATQSFSAKSDVTLGFLYNEQEDETFTLNHFKEPGKLKREPIALLMEKDFDSTTGEMNLPVTYNYAKQDMEPALSTVGNDEEQMLNNILSEHHFRPSSLLLDKPQDFNSMLDSGLLRYQEFSFGNYGYADTEDMETNFNHTALSLSHNKHYFKLSDDCTNDTSCVQDSIYVSPFQRWIRRKVSNDYPHHHPDTEAWLSSSLGQRSMSSLFHSYDNYQPEMDGGNHGEKLCHFREDMIEIYNSSLLHISMQRDNGCPLPLDGNDYISWQEQTHKMLF